MTSPPQSHRESLRVTLIRTGTIALIAGAVVALSWGKIARWPMATLLVLWPALGGHWVEVFFLEWVRPRISAARSAQIPARIAVWFVGGAILGLGMILTAMLLGQFRPADWPALWLGGIAFIGIELVAHLFLQLRGRPSFYNGLG